jgi:hypothetical protein
MSDAQTPSSSSSLERLKTRLNDLREGIRELEQGLQDLDSSSRAAAPQADTRPLASAAVARAADHLGRGETQEEILEALLDELSAAADRAVLFLRVDGGYVAHGAVGFEAPAWKGLSIGQEGPIAEAVQSREVVQIQPGGDRPEWIDRLEPGGSAALIPVFFQDRAPLLLYLDSSGRLDLGTAQVLVQLAKLLLQNRYLHYLLDVERGERPEDAGWPGLESPSAPAAALPREAPPEPSWEAEERSASGFSREAEEERIVPETEPGGMTPEVEAPVKAPEPETETVDTAAGSEWELDMPPTEAPPPEEVFAEDRAPRWASEDAPADGEREPESPAMIETGWETSRDVEPPPQDPWTSTGESAAPPPAEAATPVEGEGTRAGDAGGIYELEPLSKVAAEELGLSDEEFEKLMGKASIDWKEAAATGVEGQAAAERLDRGEAPAERIPSPGEGVGAGEEVLRESAESGVAAPLESGIPQPAETEIAEPVHKEAEGVAAEPSLEAESHAAVETQPLSAEEEAIHADARRFARLLVAEIKLYNETEVEAGRNQGDLYRRLSEDIDRSREMYEKRIHPMVRERTDYLHSELVRVLAREDATLLGVEYPGPRVARASERS